MPLSKGPKLNAWISQRALWALTILVVGLVAAAILANSMMKEVSRDEQMYCTAGVLMGQGKAIYEDFAYPSQLPYHPLLLAALFKGLGTTHYLLVGRLVSVACDVLVVALIIAIYRAAFGKRRGEGLVFGLAAVLLYAFNPLVDYAAGYAWNHDVVVLCVVLSLWLFVTTDFDRKSRYWRVALMGAFLTFATCMRVTTALAESVFLAAVLVAGKGSIKDRSRTALPFLLAAVLVLVWPVRVILRSPDAFWLNLVRIPALYGRWLHDIGMAHEKIVLAGACMLAPGYAALLVATGWSVWMLKGRWSSLERTPRSNVTMALILAGIFFVIAFIPPTMWEQYWAVPVPFLVISLAYPLADLCRFPMTTREKTVFRVTGCVIGLCAAVAVFANRVVLYRSPAVLVPERWTPIELHSQSGDVAARIDEPKLVLTLGPLGALEGRCSIYPELASGSIIYRVADLMTPEERRLTHTVGLATLGDLVKDPPPSAVMVGVEPPYFSFLEDPLRETVPAGWRRETRQNGWLVYLPP